MIQIINLSFSYGNDLSIFHQLHLSLGRVRYGLVGPNASGKSTLLALVAGRMVPHAGTISCTNLDFQYVPQLDALAPQELEDLRVLRLGRALQDAEAGAADWTFMEDRWALYAAMEQRVQEWGLANLDISQNGPWSGGTWQRLRLALSLAHEDAFLLLDEPSNHLDRDARLLLMRALREHRGGCLVASHDRELLNIMDQTLALDGGRVQVHGGPYDFYKAAFDQQQAAHHADWMQTRQQLDRARKEAQRVHERQAKRSAKGHREREKGGIPRIALGGLRMQAELTSAKLQARHEEKIGELQSRLHEKSRNLVHEAELHLDVKGVRRPGDRPILNLSQVQFRWSQTDLWPEPLHLQLRAGEHLAVVGTNASGKSTLLQLIMGRIEPTSGRIERRFRESFLLDQDLSLLPQNQSLLDIWQDPLYGNDAGLRRTIAARLGLKAREASVPLEQLSGGQRLRAALILLATRVTPPDLILLDEPSNHLDLGALDCLVATLRALPASLIVVTHDFRFLEDLSIRQTFELVRAR